MSSSLAAAQLPPTLDRLPEPMILRGPIIARLTDAEFYELCQENPQLQLERDANHHLLRGYPNRQLYQVIRAQAK